MSDVISRQAAIDICRAPHMRNADCSDFEMAIMMLPPAQPDVPDINVGDMISRQAAIDYFVINVGFHDEDGYPIEDTDELRKIWTEYFDGIPPAQPERIKGHWIVKPGSDAPPTCDKCGCESRTTIKEVVDQNLKMIYCTAIDIKSIVWIDGSPAHLSNVIAWCKPIEPYKGVTE